MSHNLTLKKNFTGKHWYALEDGNGKVRDWTQADTEIRAQLRFGFSRHRDIPLGYTVSYRGKVE